MSSIVGHAAVGACLYLAGHRFADRSTRWALPVLLLAAVLPDVDYFAVWLFGYAAHPRITHSAAFALASALMLWWSTRGASERTQARMSFAVLLAASLSHPMLDLLVGAHPVPVFWPLPVGGVSVRGILPSAGRLSLGNYYLWRNLLIEAGVLLPVLALGVAVARGLPRQAIVRWALVAAPVWVAFLAWSVGLRR